MGARLQRLSIFHRPPVVQNARVILSSDLGLGTLFAFAMIGLALGSGDPALMLLMCCVHPHQWECRDHLEQRWKRFGQRSRARSLASHFCMRTMRFVLWQLSVPQRGSVETEKK